MAKDTIASRVAQKIEDLIANNSRACSNRRDRENKCTHPTTTVSKVCAKI